MLKDLLRYKANAVFVGAVVLAVFLLLLAVAFQINRSFTLTFWDKGYEVKADFVDADGIANASDVRISGVYVGQITEIRSVAGGLAEITMRVDKAHAPLKEGTKANLRLQTLLGTKFIELEPGPANNKEIANGSVIPANATASPVDFDQLLSSFNKPTRDSLSTLIQEGGTATNGQGENINSLLGEVHNLSLNSTPDLQTFADRSDHIDSILRNLDNVSGNLSDNRTHLANTLTNLDSVLGTISTNDASFRKFIEQGNIGLGHGLNQFSGEHQNIQSIFTQLRPALHALNPELADVNRLALQFETFIHISQPFVSDIFSAVHGYNTDASTSTSAGNKTATCGSAGCGGFFLRQPTILAGSSCNGTCLSENGAAAPAATLTTAAGGSSGAAGTPRLPLGTLPNVLPSQGGSANPPPPSNDAVNGLLNYLLGR